MKKVLSLLLLLTTSYLHSTELDDPVFIQEESVVSRVYKIADSALYVAAGAAFGSVSFLSQLGWRLSQLSSGDSTTGNELLLFSHLCGSSASHIFSQMYKNFSLAKRKIPLSQSSWYANYALLSQVPAASNEEKKLIGFLEKRWLAKSTGFFPALVDWVYPCFGVSLQVNPETTSHYARNPKNKISRIYQKTVDAWKKTLPHPEHFPLILTRPADLNEYLPSYLDAAFSEKIETTVERLSLKMQTTHSKIVLDLTHIFPPSIKNKKEWLQVWQAYQSRLVECCKAHHINLSKVLCIERLQHEDIGGIRLLPLTRASSEKIGRDYRFILQWISTLGLSANLLELDRCSFSSSLPTRGVPAISMAHLSKDALISFLDSLNWKSKELMVQGTLQVLQSLLAHLSEEKWNEILKCPTRSAITLSTFNQIKQQFEKLYCGRHETLNLDRAKTPRFNDRKRVHIVNIEPFTIVESREFSRGSKSKFHADRSISEPLPFFETASHLEEIHASISTLLEIFSPFTSADFPSIYRNLLTCIPPSLKSLTSCAIHSSGMTSVAGIFKAVEKTLGRPPHVLYGENTYFECIHIAEQISHATALLEATESDLQQVDLLIAQFNPALKRIDLKPTEYHVEKIAENVNKILSARDGKPLTLALDCTFDFIDSQRVGGLLKEFREAIESGTLNIICYRSGLKFDLFGMDNYSGAPLYMIHNHDAKWQAFDALLTDPVLQSDRLSLNWFCLAYQNAAPQLELYRKQIFDNTRSLLNKIPRRLFDAASRYRVVFVEQDADIAFVDIKISGAFHQMRGAALVGGCLYMKCMEGGHPIFYRPSVGFYHPNFTMLFSKENTTIRLTLGLDPAQVDLLTECFEIIDTLNGAPQESLRKILKTKPYYRMQARAPASL